MFYQLKVIRKNTKPPIWRRIFVPSNITFAQLAVILEAILECSMSDYFEFEFYTRKERLAQWREGMNPIRDFYYSFLNAPDTFINERMESEKAFTFKIRDKQNQVIPPEYRIEIEKILDSVAYSDNGIKRKLDHPLIAKQVSAINDPFWTDPVSVNELMRERYTINVGEAKYQDVSEILAQLDAKGGISTCKKLVNRQIHNEQSANEKLKELADQLAYAMGLPQDRGTKQKVLQNTITNKSVKQQAQTSPVNRKRECKFENYLKVYSNEDLMVLAEELGLNLDGKTKNKMVHETARALLEGSTFKARLLELSEQELDIFEKVIEKGPYIPDEKEDELLDAIYDLDYLCRYKNDMVQVPDEVIVLYTAIKRNGYREYHKKASWLLRCICMANYIYISEPLDVVFQMYRQNKEIKATYQDFLSILRTIPEKMTESIIADDKLIQQSAYLNGVYKHLEQVRRKGDYYIPDKKEIELFQQDFYPSYEKSYQKLLAFLEKELQYPNDFSKYLCSHVFVILAGGETVSALMKSLYDMGLQTKSEIQKRCLTDLLMEVNNETRMPELNGYKPNDMKQFPPMISVQSEVPKEVVQQRKTEKKIYPNDPCICGSGKKYKKCCGNLRK